MPYKLIDIARMLTSIPLYDDTEIDTAKLVIKYRSGTKNECEYVSELPLEEDTKKVKK